MRREEEREEEGKEGGNGKRGLGGGSRWVIWPDWAWEWGGARPVGLSRSSVVGPIFGVTWPAISSCRLRPQWERDKWFTADDVNVCSCGSILCYYTYYLYTSYL